MSKIKNIALILLLCALLAYLGYHIYYLLGGKQLKIYLYHKETFGIALISKKHTGSTKKQESLFISIALVNSRNKRIGFISFFPDTRFNKTSTSTIGDNLLKEDFQHTIQTIAKDFSLNIPYYIICDINDIANVIDLADGINYFLWKPDILNTEILPTGEFQLNGPLTRKLLQLDERSAYVKSLVGYRHYNILLNFWRERKEKWKIFQNKHIFQAALKNVKTNFSYRELSILSNILFSNDDWLPLFWEVPINKANNKFYIDKTATSYYLNDFKRKLNQKKIHYLNRTPTIEVRNGTDTPRLAQKFRRYLNHKGFQILEFSNADHHTYKNSILLDVNTNPFYLTSSAETMQVQRIYYAINRSLFTDLIFVIGKDYRKILNHLRE